MRDQLKKSQSVSSTLSSSGYNNKSITNGITSWASQKASFAAVANGGGNSATTTTTRRNGTSSALAPSAAASSSSAAAAAGAIPPPPPPTTWVGAAALQLEAQPQHPSGPVVYLLPVEYLRRWLHWAFRVDESARDQLRRSAVSLGLAPPTAEAVFGDGSDDDEDGDLPGPVDATSLAVEGHPLVLSPLVKLHSAWWDDDGQGGDYGAPTAPVPFERSKSVALRDVLGAGERNAALTHHSDNTRGAGGGGGNDDSAAPPLLAVAVPEPFYETLRATHGVLCEDGCSVSFQPPSDHYRSPFLLHHQVFGEDASAAIATEDDNSSHHRARNHYPRPIEFRRRRITVPQRRWDSDQPPTSLMDKLLLEEPQFVSRVEVHPFKVLYTVVDDERLLGRSPSSSSASPHHSIPSPHGFGLLSRQSPAAAALRALARAAVPHKAALQLRLWVARGPYPKSPTPAHPWPYHALGDSLDNLGSDDAPGLLEDHAESVRHVLLEVRSSVNADWPLQNRELVQRLQVGDSCDAPDVAGKWYEAIVVGIDRPSNEDCDNGSNGKDGNRAGATLTPTVRVHYLGWARKWDTALVPPLHMPRPLWSRTDRWREQIAVGQVVEIRDSSSRADRPKWYKGVVRRVGHPNDPPRPIVGGAELELLDDGKPLLLLGQNRQVLVEVEQEKNSVTPALLKQAEMAAAAAIGAEPDPKGLEPQPPYRRWVNLYGEEICQLGTHLKKDETSGAPATLRYELDAGRKPVEVLKGRGAGFIRESLRGTPPAPGSVGLQNLGNSCYMNGIVQCLNHIEPLTQYFLQDKHAKELNRSNPLGSGGNVTLAYASLLKKMWSGEYCILAPRSLKQTVASFAPQFDNSYQHDSQEFCQFLMDGLHEDLNRVKTKPYVEELEGFGMEDDVAAVESWRKHLLRHDSIIVDHCQGMHRSHLTCPRCGRESIKFDVYSSISLPLVTSKNRAARIKLEDCLEKFMEGEQLDERNAWYCPSCRQHVCALKMIALWSVPDILILHLKRFTFDTCMTSGGMLRSKMDDTVEFPIEGLDLTRHILGPVDPAAPPVYKLFGVSQHYGPTANSGHYTATVRNSIDGQWYRCNDSHVGHTSGEASITSDAYLLFYQRAKGISRWGGMEKVMLDRNIDPYGGLQTDKEGFTKVNKKKKKKGTSEDSSRTTL